MWVFDGCIDFFKGFGSTRPGRASAAAALRLRPYVSLINICMHPTDAKHPECFHIHETEASAGRRLHLELPPGRTDPEYILVSQMSSI